MEDRREFLTLAYNLFQQAYEQQMEGELDEAIALYQRSIEAYPTAEAHTFLGWAYSFMGRLDEAISECKKAIQIDPDFGNPYNDIGAYLLEKSLHAEAIPWLLQASQAKRYENYHFAHFNLGRAYIALEQFNKAREEFETALRLKPEYEMAQEALDILKRRIQ
ncbi:MAG TPA: tetratricopeptide repeat protein [Acidobacteriota bacterium]|nr:tetratricopeptide repeat protein [Acidobacteriota bacterium]